MVECGSGKTGSTRRSFRVLTAESRVRELVITCTGIIIYIYAFYIVYNVGMYGRCR